MNRSPAHSFGRFFLLVFALSTPFYAVGTFAPQLSRLMPVGLPISAVMFICPAVAALWLVYRESGRSGVRALLGRAFDARRVSSVDWLLSLGVMPVAMVLSYVVQRLAGQSLPEAAWSLIGLLFAFAVYVLGAIGEGLRD